jgi:hypothetical protein
MAPEETRTTRWPRERRWCVVSVMEERRERWGRNGGSAEMMDDVPEGVEV